MRMFDRKREERFFEDRVQYTLGPAELNHRLTQKEELVVVDVRKEEDYRKGHIPGAINLPRERWDTLAGLDKDKVNIVYCSTQQCHLAPEAALFFARKGYRVMELEGGWKAWQEYGQPVEQAAPEQIRKAA